MPWRSASYFLLPVLSFWLYLHGQAAYNALVLPSLPASYFAGGPPSRCQIVKHALSDELKFCEDLAIWRTRDKAGNEFQRIIASCDPGRYEWNTVLGPLLNPDPKGGLWLINTNAGVNAAEPLRLENFDDMLDFHPVGIDIVPGSPSTLYVVNHMRGVRKTVEVFHLYDETPVRLVYHKQLYHPRFWGANSVAAISDSEFFLSIDHWFKRDGLIPGRWFAPALETLLGLPLGRVEHVKYGNQNIDVTLSIPGMPFPNGLSLSSDKGMLAVASSSVGEVRLYDIIRDGKSLSYKTTVAVPFSPDNVKYQSDGSLLVAGHPHFPSMKRLGKRKQSTAPSWVVSILDSAQNQDDDRTSGASYGAYNRVRLHEKYRIKTLYQSNGTGWSASTSAFWIGDKLIVSGLYTDGILLCLSS